MVRLVGIIQVYFLFKKGEWVSNKEMSNVLCQKMIDAFLQELLVDLLIDGQVDVIVLLPTLRQVAIY